MRRAWRPAAKRKEDTHTTRHLLWRIQRPPPIGGRDLFLRFASASIPGQDVLLLLGGKVEGSGQSPLRKEARQHVNVRRDVRHDSLPLR